MHTTSAPSAADYGLLILLSAIWGASFPLMKVAVVTIPAVPMTAFRLIIAAVLLVTYVVATGHKFPSSLKLWGLMALVAIFGNALPFSLIAWGEESVDSGLAAILMAIMPLTSLLLAHLFTGDEKLNRWKFIGVMLGLAGVVVLIGPDHLIGLGSDLARQGAIAMAAVSYSVSALVVRRITGVSQRVMTAGILMLSSLFIIIIVVSFYPLEKVSPSNASLYATIMLGVIQTGLANLIAFSILRKNGVTFFSQLNFMVPLFGLGFAVVFLSEQPGLNVYLALVIILTGIGVARYGILKSSK